MTYRLSRATPLPLFLALLLLLTVAHATPPTDANPLTQYHAGPLYALKALPRRQLMPSNAPRTECPPTETCRTALRQVTLAMRMLRAKRQAIIELAVGIRRSASATDLSEAAAELREMLAEEMRMRGKLMSMREMAIEEGCESCGQVMMEGVGVITPAAVVERECGRVMRMVRIGMSRRRVAGGVEDRIRRRMMMNAPNLERNPERKATLEERLEEVEEDVMRLTEKIRSLMRRRTALGCQG